MRSPFGVIAIFEYMRKKKLKWNEEHEEWYVNGIKPSEGFGDTAYKIFKFIGIKKLVKLIHQDCECESRRTKWNEMFPYKFKKKIWH